MKSGLSSHRKSRTSKVPKYLNTHMSDESQPKLTTIICLECSTRFNWMVEIPGIMNTLACPKCNSCNLADFASYVFRVALDCAFEVRNERSRDGKNGEH